MLLHKMLFFQLPYQRSLDGGKFVFVYSEESDQTENRGHESSGERGDSDDFTRLENEVLNYSG